MVFGLKETNPQKKDAKASKNEEVLKVALEFVQKLQMKTQAGNGRADAMKLIREMEEGLKSKLLGEKALEDMSQEELLAMILDPANFTMVERRLIQTLLGEASRVKKNINNDQSKAGTRRKNKKYRSSWVQG